MPDERVLTYRDGIHMVVGACRNVGCTTECYFWDGLVHHGHGEAVRDAVLGAPLWDWLRTVHEHDATMRHIGAGI